VQNDPYTELGIARGASSDVIRKAYRALAKELHPDTRPDDRDSEERFKRVTAAFHFLNDADRRRRFDRGEIDAEGNTRRRNGHGRRPTHGADFDDIGDVFSSMFGGGARRGPFRATGEDVRYRLEVEFVEAANGGRKRVVMGDGKALDLVIPEGVRPGAVLRLRGQGKPGPSGAAPGDAMVEIDVLSHPIFERRDNDIWLDLPITLPEAVVGAKVQVPTLTGQVSLTIPKGSNSGRSEERRVGKECRSRWSPYH